MMSLVPSYEDDEDDEVDFENNSDSISGAAVKNQECQPDPGPSQDKINVSLPLFAGQEPSESSESDSEEESFQNPNPSKITGMTSLSNPFRTLEEAREVGKDDSVFQIAFRDEEDRKVKTLEKHVKMTTRTDLLSTINDKKVCWNFRRGRCRFGHNCIFAHDSDLQESDKAEESSGGAQTGKEKPPPPKKAPEESEEISSTMVGEPHYPDCTVGVAKKRKKRPGLSQSLVPGKKVMKEYFRQQQSGK